MIYILSTYHQARYISFYLQGQLYELNLGTFNNIFSFPPSMDLPNRQVSNEFNPNAFWGLLSRGVRYRASSSKCTHIRNPCIHVAQRILACCFFATNDGMNVPRLSELYFFSCLLDDVQLDSRSFLARQLYSAAISTKGKVVIGGITTTIARFLAVELSPEDRVSRSERLDQAAF